MEIEGSLQAEQDPGNPQLRPGNNKGKKLLSLTQKQWYTLIKLFVDNKQMYKSANEYLRSPASDPLSLKNKNAFGNWLKKYNNGTLTSATVEGNPQRHRKRGSKHDIVESKLMQYIHQRAEQVKQGNDHLTWKELKEESMRIFKSLPEDQTNNLEFIASDGWLSRFLKRENISLRNINMHGEQGDGIILNLAQGQDEESRKRTASALEEIQRVCAKYNLPLKRFSTADQSFASP
mmetsp:Transcript_39882/g.58592  ORF Transcript_39882/g.58592 Transcript_39882/m.58592 type:complete len:234 (+) Transcript_39882:225-926(+)|eukprot:CAMPEP_0195511322 /NCGR_PEP_ID=MMETSP0794_2-20130614/3682_1 /TAXON_ID=515487 /ORGANISM="Stephanopyxis turris, Strain CCMP 815" /LENGTH=233 /DNA_ID=CAMNT_0040638895 /DNA_START=10 /DNA_END=711 /DNA_ORIENTATION=-